MYGSNKDPSLQEFMRDYRAGELDELIELCIAYHSEEAIGSKKKRDAILEKIKGLAGDIPEEELVNKLNMLSPEKPKV